MVIVKAALSPLSDTIDRLLGKMGSVILHIILLLLLIVFVLFLPCPHDSLARFGQSYLPPVVCSTFSSKVAQIDWFNRSYCRPGISPLAPPSITVFIKPFPLLIAYCTFHIFSFCRVHVCEGGGSSKLSSFLYEVDVFYFVFCLALL